jgi:hypothetical protein
MAVYRYLDLSLYSQGNKTITFGWLKTIEPQSTKITSRSPFSTVSDRYAPAMQAV